MQRFLDKWGLWFALVIVGGIMAFGIIKAQMQEDEKPPAKNAATQAAPGALKID